MVTLDKMHVLSWYCCIVSPDMRQNLYARILESEKLRNITKAWPFPRLESSARKSFRKPIFLDIRHFLSFPELQVGIPTIHSTSTRRFPYEKTPQNVYALLLIGIICLLGAQIFFCIKPNPSWDEDGKPRVLIFPVEPLLKYPVSER